MRSTLSIALLFIAAAQSARAQTPAEQTILAQWDDSVARVVTLSALDRFAAHSVQVESDLKDLRLALIQLRRATIANDRSLRELALIRLDAVAHAHSGWAWPQFLFAKAFYEMSDSGAEFKLSSGLREGEQYIDAAMRHLGEALRLDPAMPQARHLALDVLVPEGDREFRDPERLMIRSLLAAGRPECDVYLVAGRDYRTRLKFDSALAQFDKSLAAGGDPSRLQLERSRTLQALGNPVAATQAYWNGAEQLTAIGREMYRHDLAWILAPDSLSQFDRLPADSVNGWLRDFWVRRDAAAANRPGERLEEHLRRWNYALAHFRVDRPWRLNESRRVEYMFDGLDACVGNDSGLYELLSHEQPIHPNDPRHREPLLDHRGLVYLHHGAPYRVVYNPQTDSEPPGFALTNPPAARLVAVYDDGKRPEPPADGWCIGTTALATGPNESWLYWFGGAWRVMNFRGSCTLGVLQPTTLTSYLPVLGAEAWAARSDLTSAYEEAALQILNYKGQTPTTCLDHVLPMIRISRADADVGTRTDSHTPFVPRPWNAVIQAFALGAGIDQSGEALVTFAIPFDSLQPTHRPNGTTTYNVMTRIVGYDFKSGRTFTVDTAREFASPRQGAGARGHVSGWFEFAVDPGDWQIAVRMWQPGDSIGAYALHSHVRVDGSAPLMVSDLIAGAANGAPWPAPDGALFPLGVLAAWPVGATADLYYEVRGLKSGDAYQTVIAVNDVDGKSRNIVLVESTDRATGTMSPVRKSLDLSQLKPGRYVVSVTLTHGTSTAVRSRELMIVKP